MPVVAAEELQSFRAGYRIALERWRAGDRDVVFPPGTWKMCVLHGARVADLSRDGQLDLVLLELHWTAATIQRTGIKAGDHPARMG